MTATITMTVTETVTETIDLTPHGKSGGGEGSELSMEISVPKDETQKVSCRYLIKIINAGKNAVDMDKIDVKIWTDYREEKLNEITEVYKANKNLKEEDIAKYVKLSVQEGEKLIAIDFDRETGILDGESGFAEIYVLFKMPEGNSVDLSEQKGAECIRLNLAALYYKGAKVWGEEPTTTTTFSPTYSCSPTWTETQTITEIDTITMTATITETETNTGTSTETSTITETETITPTHTITETNTISPTESITETATPTSTLSSTITASPEFDFSESPTLTQTPTMNLTLLSSAETLKKEEVSSNLNFNDKSVYVFPNPASRSLNIRFPLEYVQNVKIAIYGLDGKMVWSRFMTALSVTHGINRIAWDCKNSSGIEAANGVYLLEVCDEKECIRKKIAVIR
jgi:hypothetical protein